MSRSQQVRRYVSFESNVTKIDQSLFFSSRLTRNSSYKHHTTQVECFRQCIRGSNSDRDSSSYKREEIVVCRQLENECTFSNR
mmetsp:Transcript_8541/g.16966  ORF Transcript_8541/g.16966 Transcript_8541/m.16966 type:complete len:83 (-) Transcript_8541:1051-1299(-)